MRGFTEAVVAKAGQKKNEVQRVETDRQEVLILEMNV